MNCLVRAEATQRRVNSEGKCDPDLQETGSRRVGVRVRYSSAGRQRIKERLHDRLAGADGFGSLLERGTTPKLAPVVLNERVSIPHSADSS